VGAVSSLEEEILTAEKKEKKERGDDSGCKVSARKG
jgi:hypothetical protein